MNSSPMEIKKLNAHDMGIAKKSFQQIDKLKGRVQKQATLNLAGLHIELPPAAVKLMVAILGEMAEGHALALVPSHAFLSTQEGADMLNVSRPYFVKLLQEGKIPFEKVGNRRRVLASDVMIFKNKSLLEREKMLQQLTEQAEDLDMGYK